MPSSNTPNYTLPTVEVKASAPSWLKYQKQFEKSFPLKDRVQSYLTPLARAMGNSADNYPDRIKEEYARDGNDYIARELLLSGQPLSGKDKQIISQSRYANKSAEYAYNNPVKLPVWGDDPYLNYLYKFDFLTRVPGARQAIQYMAGKKISRQDVEDGYHNKKQAEITAGADPMDYSNQKVNLLSQYLFSDQKLKKSSAKPGSDYLPFLPSYSLKDKLGVDKDFAENMQQYLPAMEQIKKEPLFLNGLGKMPYATQPDLGHYKSGVAWDNNKQLPYYFVSDAWDFDPSDYSTRYGKNPDQTYQQSFLLQKAGNPFKIYDRFYFSPDDGKYQEFRSGGRVSASKMPKAALGYDLQPVYTRFDGDPAALSRPLPNIETLPSDPVGTVSKTGKKKGWNIPETNIGLGPAFLGLSGIINNWASLAEDSRMKAQKARIAASGFENPDPGDGSQVLFKQGGSVKTPGSITRLSDNIFSAPVIRFNGPDHENGGIPISYGGRNIEVEGNETGWISDDGDLNVFGNLKIPGSNMKFKTGAAKLAKLEQKATSMQQKALSRLSGLDPDEDKLRYNSANLALQEAVAQQKKLSVAKSQLASLQNSLLAFNDQQIRSAKAAKGVTVPPGSGSNWDLPATPDEVLRQAAVINSRYPVVPMVHYPQQGPVTPAGQSGTITEQDVTGDTIGRKARNSSRFDFTQILPEAYALASNKVADDVNYYNFQPSLLPLFQVSSRDRLQENNSTFQTLVNKMGNNPAALSQLAAGKYSADSQVLAATARQNQEIRQQIAAENNRLLNTAGLQRLQDMEKADIARAQNIAATKAVNREALRSISAKVLQKKNQDATLNLINQLAPYHYYSPETGRWELAGEAAPLNIGTMPLDLNYWNNKEKTVYTRDNKGKITSRVKSGKAETLFPKNFRF